MSNTPISLTTEYDKRYSFIPRPQMSHQEQEDKREHRYNIKLFITG